MDTNPFVTINPQSPTSPGRHQFSPLSPIESGFTPMILCTDPYGMQILTPIPIFAHPVVMVPQMVAIEPVDTAFPVPSLTLSHSPSSSYRRCQRSSIPNNEKLDVLPGSSELPEFQHQAKKAVKNDKNISVPEFTTEMTKKDLVNLSLDWLYEVFGSDHFDCDGRRGRNVLRIKVKTRGALEYICVLVQRCIDEGIIHHVSCPISTKKQRKHIRGYLAYLEAVSDEATARMIEIFNELNTAFVENCDGEMEHPFKGISRNPIPIRHNQVAA